MSVLFGVGSALHAGVEKHEKVLLIRGQQCYVSDDIYEELCFSWCSRYYEEYYLCESPMWQKLW